MGRGRTHAAERAAKILDRTGVARRFVQVRQKGFDIVTDTDDAVFPKARPPEGSSSRRLVLPRARPVQVSPEDF